MEGKERVDDDKSWKDRSGFKIFDGLLEICLGYGSLPNCCACQMSDSRRWAMREN
jgi:hypothetical protein